MESLTIMVSAFARKYEPVTKLEDSTDFLTAEEVYLMFGCGETLLPETVNKQLNQSGFKMELVDSRFVWLVKEKAG